MAAANKVFNEHGISENLYNTWKETMQALLGMCRQKFTGTTVKVEDKTAIVLEQWHIQANIVNAAFIEVVLEKESDERIRMKVHDNLALVVHTVFRVIKFDNVIKM